MSEKEDLPHKNPHKAIMPHISPISSKSIFKNILSSFKSHKHKAETDLDLPILYQSMLKRTSTQPKRIELNRLMNHNRRQMISKMKDFLAQSRLSSSLLFNAISYLDALLSTKTKMNIDKLGIGALILAVKFNENEIKSPYMKEYYYLSSHSFYSLNYLLQIELICLKKLNYCLDFVQPIHYLQLLLCFIISADNHRAKHHTISLALYSLPYRIMEIAMESIEYTHYHPLHIACSCIGLARELSHIDKWKASFEKVFKIEASAFDQAYAFVKHAYDSKANNARGSFIDMNDSLFRESRAGSTSHIQSSNTEFKLKSSFASITSKSLEKTSNRYDNLICQLSQSQSKKKVGSSKSSQEETMNVSAINPHKNRNSRLGDPLNSYVNCFSKRNRKLSGTVLGKDDTKGSEKKKDMKINSVMGKHVDLTSIIYTSLLRSNNYFNSNATRKRKISNDDKKASNPSCPYTRRGKRNSSLTRGSFNYSDLFQDKAQKHSIFSLKSKKQYVSLLL